MTKQELHDTIVHAQQTVDAQRAQAIQDARQQKLESDILRSFVGIAMMVGVVLYILYS